MSGDLYIGGDNLFFCNSVYFSILFDELILELERREENQILETAFIEYTKFNLNDIDFSELNIQQFMKVFNVIKCVKEKFEKGNISRKLSKDYLLGAQHLYNEIIEKMQRDPRYKTVS